MNEKIKKITALLDEKKAEKIQLIDLRGGEYFADWVLLANCLGPRHSAALIDELKKLLGRAEILAIDEGEEWSVLDLGDLIIHLLSEEARARYALEELLDKFKRA